MKSATSHPWLRRVSDYQSGSISAAERAAVEGHLAVCAECRQALATYRRFYALAHSPLQLDFAEMDVHIGDLRNVAGPFGHQQVWPTGFPQHHPGRPSRVGLATIAAMLLVSLLTAALLRLHGGSHPQPRQIAVPGVGTLARFPLPHAGSQPRLIVAGPDDSLWFGEDGRIGRITSAGAITEFQLPVDTIPAGLTLGADGNVWFTTGSTWIGRLNPRDTVVTEFPLPAGSPPAYPIVAGPDGNLWFGAGRQSGQSVAIQSEIGRITPMGAISMFPLADHTTPVNLAAGRDGNIWFTTLFGSGIDWIGRITPLGTISWFRLPNFNEEPNWIIAGPDGNVWFTDPYGAIGRITPQGAFTVFTFDSGQLNGLAAGPDGNLWLTDPASLWRVTPTGTFAEFAFPPGVTLDGITAGPDSTLWATDISGNAIVRIELARSG